MRVEHEESQRAELQEPDLPRRWRCNLYTQNIIHSVGRPKKYVTSGPKRHLVKTHRIVVEPTFSSLSGKLLYI